jgi:hypothetical protein
MIAIAIKPKSEAGKSRAKMDVLRNEMVTRPACEIATHWTLEKAEEDLNEVSDNLQASASSHAPRGAIATSLQSAAASVGEKLEAARDWPSAEAPCSSHAIDLVDADGQLDTQKCFPAIPVQSRTLLHIQSYERIAIQAPGFS